MTQLIKKLKHLPLTLTIENRTIQVGGEDVKHKSNLTTGALWDYLRKNHPRFYLPTDRNAWLKMCETEKDKDGLDGRLIQRADDIVQLLKMGRFETLFSVGVGSAALEYHIKKQYPDIQLICTERAPRNVHILQEVFKECNKIYEFNILDADWKIPSRPDKRMVLLNRLDPLLRNDQWRQVFMSMHGAQIEHVLFIPMLILNLSLLYKIQLRLVRYKLSQTPTVFTGWLRTRKAFQYFWQTLYQDKIQRFGGLTSFLLKRTNTTEQINGCSSRPKKSLGVRGNNSL